MLPLIALLSVRLCSDMHQGLVKKNFYPCLAHSAFQLVIKWSNTSYSILDTYDTFWMLYDSGVYGRLCSCHNHNGTFPIGPFLGPSRAHYQSAHDAVFLISMVWSNRPEWPPSIIAVSKDNELCFVGSNLLMAIMILFKGQITMIWMLFAYCVTRHWYNYFSETYGLMLTGC